MTLKIFDAFNNGIERIAFSYTETELTVRRTPNRAGRLSEITETRRITEEQFSALERLQPSASATASQVFNAARRAPSRWDELDPTSPRYTVDCRA